MILLALPLTPVAPGLSPSPAVGQTSAAASLWVPIATLVAAMIAATAAIVSAVLQRKSGREAAEAARQSVAVNERTSAAVARRAEADALSKRYQDAAGLLGHERAAVRRAGVYAMARLADDWPDQRQVCVDVLCGYLQMSPIDQKSEPEVRLAISSVLAEHLHRDAGDISWSGLRINLANAHLEELDFTDAVFLSRVRFDGAIFAGRCLMDRVTFAKGAGFVNAKTEKGALLRLECCDLGRGTSFEGFVVGEDSSVIVFQETPQHIVVTGMCVRGTFYVLLNPEHEGERYDFTNSEIEQGATLRVDYGRKSGRFPRGSRASLAVSVTEGGEIYVPQPLIDGKVVEWCGFSAAGDAGLSFTLDPDS